MSSGGGTACGRDEHLGYILAMTYSPDGRRLYYATAGEGAVYVRDTASGALRARWPCHDGPVMELRCPGDGRQLFTASLDGTVGVWRSADGASIRRLGGFRQGVHSLDVSERHVAAGGFDGLVQVWVRGAAAPPARREAHRDAVIAVALISSSHLVTASRDRFICRIYDLEQRSLVNSVALRSPIPAADFAANGDLIALSATGDVLSVSAVSR